MNNLLIIWIWAETSAPKPISVVKLKYAKFKLHICMIKRNFDTWVLGVENIWAITYANWIHVFYDSLKKIEYILFQLFSVFRKFYLNPLNALSKDFVVLQYNFYFHINYTLFTFQKSETTIWPTPSHDIRSPFFIFICPTAVDLSCR